MRLTEESSAPGRMGDAHPRPSGDISADAHRSYVSRPGRLIDLTKLMGVGGMRLRGEAWSRTNQDMSRLPLVRSFLSRHEAAAISFEGQPRIGWIADTAIPGRTHEF